MEMRFWSYCRDPHKVLCTCQSWSRCSFHTENSSWPVKNSTDMHDWSVWTGGVMQPLYALGFSRLQKQPLNHKQTVIIASSSIFVCHPPPSIFCCTLPPPPPTRCPSLSVSVASGNTHIHAQLHPRVGWGGDKWNHVSCACVSVHPWMSASSFSLCVRHEQSFDWGGNQWRAGGQVGPQENWAQRLRKHIL